MHWLMQRCLTKPLWWWETRRPYPIRNRVFRLAPISVEPQCRLTLAVLTTSRTANNAAWTAYSILKNLSIPAALNVIVDGALSPKRCGQFHSLFPGLTLSSTDDHLAALSSRCPALLELARTHPMAGKMATIMNLQSRTHLLFSDDDVLAFQPMLELKTAIAAGLPYSLYLHEHASGSVQEEPSIKIGLQVLGLDWLKDINVGLLAVPKASLDIGLCDRILQASPPVKTWFPDTMLLAALLAQGDSRVLPDSYVVSNQRQFISESDVDYNMITLRHFVSPVRHLMYSRGMPQLWSQTSTLSSGI